MASYKRRRTVAPVLDVADEFHRRQAAGDQLLTQLQSMYSSGARMTAAHFCQLCSLAGSAGAVGPVADWGMAPGQPTGHYQRFLEQNVHATIPASNVEVMNLSLPGFNRGRRADMTLGVRPFHELLAKEATTAPHVIAQWKDQLAQTRRPA
eukprot:1890037-Pyramimonas_sp.AAC.1